MRGDKYRPMDATILAVNWIGVGGGGDQKWARRDFYCAVLPYLHQDFRGSAREPSRQIFLKKKLAGTLGVDPRLEGALSVLGAESDVYVPLAPPPTYSTTFVTKCARILRRTISPALISIGTLLRITARMSTTQ